MKAITRFARKRWFSLLTTVLVLCALAQGLPVTAYAQDPPWPPYPVCQESELGLQKILICMPLEMWNGQLVVYAHGYVHPHAPLALPAGELAQVTQDGATVVGFLLSQGYAFATTSYSKNGYAVEQASKDLNELVRHFKTHVLPNAGLLDKVLIVGGSEGGLITTMQVEKYPGIYDGGLAMCGPLGGMGEQLRYLGDFRVVFDVLFPDVFEFGMADVPDDAWEDWETWYKPVAIPGAMSLNHEAVMQLFSVTGAPFDPLNMEMTMGQTTLQVLYYSVVGTPDLVATARGIPYDNMDTVYPGWWDGVPINDAVERVDADGRALAYIRRAYQPTGKLKRPLVTLHNDLDPAVPAFHEALYAARAWSSGNLFPYPLPLAAKYGHCDFTFGEVVGAFNLLVSKVGP